VLPDLRFGKTCEFRNSSSKPITLVSDQGDKLVIAPGGGVVNVSFENGRVWRLACDECGLADGTHHTWCPLHLPYEVSE